MVEVGDAAILASLREAADKKAAISREFFMLSMFNRMKVLRIYTHRHDASSGPADPAAPMDDSLVSVFELKVVQTQAHDGLRYSLPGWRLKPSSGGAPMA